jgi:hypothetical protein
MVEVASAKNWKEITVSGTDDFRRSAWLEASLNGMKVRGYEPREADKQMLAELQERQKTANAPSNSIAVVDRERNAEPRQPSPVERTAGDHKPELSREANPSQRRHIDGDALTPHEKTVLDNSRAILNAKALGEQFTEATLRELEAKLRGERVYVGEIVEHGKARYKFDKDNDESYYVTLKTREGEQVIWGKGLPEALEDRKVGEQIVLQNVGKRDVVVQERVRNPEGQVIGSRLKESHLNAWEAEPLSRFSEKARAELANRSVDRQPSLGVYDAKAPRSTTQPVAPVRNPDLQRTSDQHRSAEQQRNARER